jgi:hypothetical protein
MVSSSMALRQAALLQSYDRPDPGVLAADPTATVDRRSLGEELRRGGHPRRRAADRTATADRYSLGEQLRRGDTLEALSGR